MLRIVSLFLILYKPLYTLFKTIIVYSTQYITRLIPQKYHRERPHKNGESHTPPTNVNLHKNPVDLLKRVHGAPKKDLTLYLGNLDFELD